MSSKISNTPSNCSGSPTPASVHHVPLSALACWAPVSASVHRFPAWCVPVCQTTVCIFVLVPWVCIVSLQDKNMIYICVIVVSMLKITIKNSICIINSKSEWILIKIIMKLKNLISLISKTIKLIYISYFFMWLKFFLQMWNLGAK